jgi:hypothetical protein
MRAPGVIQRWKVVASGKPGHGAREFSHGLKVHRQETIKTTGRKGHVHMVAEQIVKAWLKNGGDHMIVDVLCI